MREGPFLSIEDVEERIVEALENLGWDTEVETYYPRDYMHIWANKFKGLLKAFVCIEVIIMALDGDPNNVDIIFYFYADPSITGKGKDKRPFGRMARQNDAEVFRKFCGEVSDLANMDVEFLNWSCETSPSSSRLRFEGGKPAYVVTLYYWKRPLERSEGGYLALNDRKELLRELRETLRNKGFRAQWKNPIMVKGDKRGDRHLCFYIKQDLFRGLLGDAFKYKFFFCRIRVDFDMLSLYSTINGIETPEPLPREKIESLLREKFKSLTKSFPELEYFLEEIGSFKYVVVKASFPTDARDRLIALLERLRRYHGDE